MNKLTDEERHILIESSEKSGFVPEGVETRKVAEGLVERGLLETRPRGASVGTGFIITVTGVLVLRSFYEDKELAIHLKATDLPKE